jgi:hypothetical protein
LVAGEINWPRMVPNVFDLKSFWGLFTAIPIMMSAYICHHNGKCQYPLPCLCFISIQNSVFLFLARAYKLPHHDAR